MPKKQTHAEVVSEETLSEAVTTLFSDLGLPEEILSVLEEIGYTKPSPIQAATIPHILNGNDVLGQAQTGTGKTAAFALPTLAQLNLKSKETQVLVLAPTRELAIQVAESFKTYSKNMKGVNIATIYGGQDYKIQLSALAKGAHVVVGTPGRVIDHITRKSLKIDNLHTMILDEADEMLRMGFIDDVEWILSKTPEVKQTTLFSATMPREIKKIVNNYLNNPVEVAIASKTKTATSINQRYLVVNGSQKMTALARILEIEPFDAALVFAKTKTATVEISDYLIHLGFKAAAINGDLQQKQRERAIELLKSGKLDVLVATDVAARGLDVERISHVINYDIPQDNESYIHRIGRTGRAGRTGDAILFITPRERRLLASIENTTKKTIDEFTMPTINEINEKRIEHFKGRITRVLEGKDNTAFEDILTQYCEETGSESIKVAAALAKIGQGRKPLLLTAEDEIKSAPERKSRESGRDGRSDSSYGRERGGDRDNRSSDRPRRDSRRKDDSEMDLYRIEVGRDDNIKPSNVVGAIANEAGIDGSSIGQIEIYDDYTTVSLPKGLSNSTISTLKNTRIAGKKANISLLGDSGSAHKVGESKRRKPASSFEGSSSERSKSDSPYSSDKPRARRSDSPYSSDKPRAAKSDSPYSSDKPRAAKSDSPYSSDRPKRASPSTRAKSDDKPARVRKPKD